VDMLASPSEVESENSRKNQHVRLFATPGILHSDEPYFVDKDPHPVCRGGNYFDVPGNARCAVRLGIHSPTYSDSRDGFRICLGRPVPGEPAK